MPSIAPGARNTWMNKTNESATIFEPIFSCECNVAISMEMRLKCISAARVKLEFSTPFSFMKSSITTMPTRLEHSLGEVGGGKGGRGIKGKRNSLQQALCMEG